MRPNVFGCDRLCLPLRIDHADGRFAGLGGSLRAESGVDIAEDLLVAPVGKGLDDCPADSVGTASNEYTSFHGTRIFHKDSAKEPFAVNQRTGFAISQWNQ